MVLSSDRWYRQLEKWRLFSWWRHRRFSNRIEDRYIWWGRLQGIILECGRRDLNEERDTNNILVGDYFKKKHENGDEMEEVPNKLEDVHESRVVSILYNHPYGIPSQLYSITITIIYITLTFHPTTSAPLSSSYLRPFPILLSPSILFLILHPYPLCLFFFPALLDAHAKPFHQEFLILRWISQPSAPLSCLF